MESRLPNGRWHLSKAQRKACVVLAGCGAAVFAALAFALFPLFSAGGGRAQPTPTPTAAPMPTARPAPATEKPEQTQGPPRMLAYMAELYEQNPDIVGYLHIEGTKMDGPVVYTPGEDHYLRRGFDGQKSTAGCLFVDKYNTVDPRDANLIIHGHNMNNGTMFHDLLKYKDEGFYREHKTIRFDSLYEEAEYEVVAAFVSQVYYVSDTVFKYYKQYDFADEAAFSDFWENIQKLSLYDTGATARFGDEFITLSTCDYSREDGRMVVIARKLPPQGAPSD